MQPSKLNYSYESPLSTPNTSSSEYPKIETIPLSPKSLERNVETVERSPEQTAKISGLLVQASKSWNSLNQIATSKSSRIFRSLSFGSRSQNVSGRSDDLKKLESELNKFKATAPHEKAVKGALNILLAQEIEYPRTSTFNLRLDAKVVPLETMTEKFAKLNVDTTNKDKFSISEPDSEGYISCTVKANWQVLWELRNCDWIVSVQSTVNNGFSPSMKRKN